MISIILGHLNNGGINRVVFTYHLPVFYLVTGYFMNDRESYGRFVLKKARTLLVPYAIACAGIIVSGAAFGFLSGGAEEAAARAGEHFRAALFGSGVGFDTPIRVRSIGALWFLWATFWGSLLLRSTLKMHPALRIAVLAAAFAAAAWSVQKIWIVYSVQTGCCAAAYMYIGYAAGKAKEITAKIPAAVKAAGAAIAFFVWYTFIRDFKSFWLVQFDMGRGALDFFRSLCASGCVFLIARGLDRFTKRAGDFLAYFGKYSILVLFVHIIELKTFPWDGALDALCRAGAPEAGRLWYTIGGKLILDLGMAFALSKIPFVRKAFGLERPAGAVLSS